MSRQYVHLSGDFQTAMEVGRQHGSPVVITINAETMAHDGVTFYLSETVCGYAGMSRLRNFSLKGRNAKHQLVYLRQK